jgi:hypothetical protein
MTTPIYKLLLFLKRKSDMSVQDFRDYYENVHSKLCEQYAYGVRRYVRRYVQPLTDPQTGIAAEMDFDVITELWFDDQAIFEKAVELMARGVTLPVIVADEERLFDRSKMRYARVVECDSEAASLGGTSRTARAGNR